jgi:hypothetical protein
MALPIKLAKLIGYTLHTLWLRKIVVQKVKRGRGRGELNELFTSSIKNIIPILIGNYEYSMGEMDQQKKGQFSS